MRECATYPLAAKRGSVEYSIRPPSDPWAPTPETQRCGGLAFIKKRRPPRRPAGRPFQPTGNHPSPAAAGANDRRRGGAEAGVRRQGGDRAGPLRHGAPLLRGGDGGSPGAQDHAQGAAACAGDRPSRPRARGAGAQGAPPRLRPAARQPPRGRAPRRVRGRRRRPPGPRPLRGRGPLLPRHRPGTAPGARGGGTRGAARRRARRVPPPRGRAPGRQAGQPLLRWRGRAQARGFRVRGVVRGRPPHVWARRDPLLRGARGRGRRGVHREGGRVERRGRDLRHALRDRALLRRHRAGDLRGRATLQPAIPAARLRGGLAGGQGPHAPHALQGRLPQVLRRASPKASMDRHTRGERGLIQMLRFIHPSVPVVDNGVRPRGRSRATFCS